ncbi:MAG: hypothetical protein EHM19_01865 [Candidatus Latescibacterota bacterium]|nr:MAG: hypothetical protein EHM19_01865 [Candidatus Latescibacterota bacterium]
MEEIAFLRGIAREEADRITTENTRRLFRLEG